MRFPIRFTTILPVLVVAATQAFAQQRSIAYQWLNEPCAEVIGCEDGCTACNLPRGSDAAFFGTNAAWMGLSTCPLPFAAGDNAVFTDGWGAQPAEGKGLLISLVALAPTALDSIVLQHRAWGDGPERLRVSLRLNTGEWDVLHDGPVMDAWEKLAITGQGCLAAQDGMAYGFAQLMVQAYGGGDGAWVIDELHIAGSACQPDFSTGIADMTAAPKPIPGPWFDALGRASGARPANGAYQSAGRRAVVVQ